MKKTLIVVACLLVLVGCKTAVETPSGTPAQYNKVDRELRAVLQAGMPEVANATSETLDDLELVAIDSTVDRLKGRITAQMAVGTKVFINLQAADVDHTAIRIRVGTFGDPSISMQILRNVEKRLEAD
jgi:hypothetical protein